MAPGVQATALGTRVVPFAVNTRDLVGLRGPRGRHIRPGLFYRGCASAVAELRARHGLRTVFDLRHGSEIGVGDCARLPEPHVLSRPVVSDRAVLRAARWPQPSAYLAYYQQLARVAAPVAVELLDVLGDQSQMPVLVCCTAGKDRTSIVSALALRAVGVRIADIARDHALTARSYRRDVPLNCRPEWASAMERRQYVMRTTTVADTVRQLIIGLEHECGSIPGLLTRHGLRRTELNRAAAALFGGAR